MPPKPPSPTLSPYTTLFRSFQLHDSATSQKFLETSCLIFFVQPRFEDDYALGIWPRHVRRYRVGRMPARRRDRKSTRLNSSHTVISYAVFCLKKKNINARPG